MKLNSMTCLSTMLLAGLAVAPAYGETPQKYAFQLDESVMAEEEYVTPTEDPNSLSFLAPAAGTPSEEKAAAQAKPADEVEEPARDIPIIDAQNDRFISPNISYVTGGIGDEERQAIEAAKADYNLQLMNTSAAGAWMGDARIVVSKQLGKDKSEKVLSVVSGPLLYVKLPEGKYTLDAAIGDVQKHYQFTVTAKKTVRIVLGWKQ